MGPGHEVPGLLSTNMDKLYMQDRVIAYHIKLKFQLTDNHCMRIFAGGGTAKIKSPT
jgi:hypothetical protein